MKMSYIDVAIPAIIGFMALVWPKIMFAGGAVQLPTRRKFVSYVVLALSSSPRPPFISLSKLSEHEGARAREVGTERSAAVVAQGCGPP
jgi:hypothetical protein